MLYIKVFGYLQLPNSWPVVIYFSGDGEKPGGAQGIFLAHAQRSLLEGLEGEPHGVLRIELGQLHARQTALPTVLPLQLMSCCYSRK